MSSEGNHDETPKPDPQHQMDFILQQQAVFSSEMIELKQGIAELRESQQRQSDNLDKLAAIVLQLAEVTESQRQDTQGAIDNLIIANEATRELANNAARLAIGVSQRLTAHEQKPHQEKAGGDAGEV